MFLLLLKTKIHAQTLKNTQIVIEVLFNPQCCLFYQVFSIITAINLFLKSIVELCVIITVLLLSIIFVFNTIFVIFDYFLVFFAPCCHHHPYNLVDFTLCLFFFDIQVSVFSFYLIFNFKRVLVFIFSKVLLFLTVKRAKF